MSIKIKATSNILEKISLVNQANDALNTYDSDYSSSEIVDSTILFMTDIYPELNALIDLICPDKYSHEERVLIGNLVFSMKGLVDSISLVNKYLDIDGVDVEVFNHLKIVVNIDILKIDEYQTFLDLYKKLIAKLLYFNNLELNINSILFSIISGDNVIHSHYNLTLVNVVDDIDFVSLEPS